MKKILRSLSHVQIIALGFFLLILLGTLLLCTPFATASGERAPFADALFTATSASCVTGLVTLDTGTVWSFFGQAVILLLIQIGGLGFMTIATVFFMLFRRRLGLRQKEVMTESINGSAIGGILKLAKHIVIGTLIAEGLGSLILGLRAYFSYGYAPTKALWFGVFHAVSAFCNAGFDINGNFSSFTGFLRDPVICVTIMVLIVLGGLGFFVWEEIFGRTKKPFCSFRLHTKIVLVSTALLILLPAVFFFFSEAGASHKNLSVPEAILASFFDAVTPRTAGMNVTDTAALSNPGVLMTTALMFIGGSPSSTAGGIKTTTLVVLLLFAVATIRRSRHVSIFGRRLPDDCVKKALSVFFTNLILALCGITTISLIQPALPLRDLVFEGFSAMGTVGMSTGITRELVTASKGVLILLMFCGRVGSISFGSALIEKKAPPPIKDPVESITIG